MPSPFPGMDPYLEARNLWPDFHQRMITYIGDELNRHIAPRYRARMEERLVVLPREGWILPDVSVIDWHGPADGEPHQTALAEEDVATIAISDEPLRETYIEIVDYESKKDIVTVVELLSPTNKRPGDGRDKYIEKQQAVLASPTSLVEIDLLRAGRHTVAAPRSTAEWFGPYHYLSCVRRGCERDRFYLCRRTVRDPLVPIRIPLAADDKDTFLDLPAVFARCYDAAAYGPELDYTQPPPDRLPPEDEAWADALLKEKGLQ